MASSSFDISVWIQEQPEPVFMFLSSLPNHAKIHPLILKIEPIPPIQGTNYRITDQIPMGPFHFRIRYWVNFVPGIMQIKSTALQFPNIRLVNLTRFLPERDGTRILEQVDIDAPRLLIGTVTRQAIEAHQASFQNVKRFFESGGEHIEQAGRYSALQDL